jgi:hypothetical protein
MIRRSYSRHAEKAAGHKGTKTPRHWPPDAKKKKKYSLRYSGMGTCTERRRDISNHPIEVFGAIAILHPSAACLHLFGFDSMRQCPRIYCYLQGPRPSRMIPLTSIRVWQSCWPDGTRRVVGLCGASYGLDFDEPIAIIILATCRCVQNLFKIPHSGLAGARHGINTNTSSSSHPVGSGGGFSCRCNQLLCVAAVQSPNHRHPVA